MFGRNSKKAILFILLILMVSMAFGQWRMDLHFDFYAPGEYLFDEASFGTAIGSHDSLDENDLVQPPTPPGPFMWGDFRIDDPLVQWVSDDFRSTTDDTLYFELVFRISGYTPDSIIIDWSDATLPSEGDIRIGMEVIDTLLLKNLGNPTDSTGNVIWADAQNMRLDTRMEVPFPYCYSHPVHLRYIQSGIDDKVGDNPQVPEDIQLVASPNPFNGAVNIDVPAGYDLAIYDIEGRIAARYEDVDGNIIWQPKANDKSGIYFARATDGKNTVQNRIIYIK
ncbi:MAG: T9SS type A sorting domain-containing protein [Candidatus Zixiibacteriota bacterium]